MAVATLGELERLVERVRNAQTQYEGYNQEQVDKLFRAAGRAGWVRPEQRRRGAPVGNT